MAARVSIRHFLRLGAALWLLALPEGFLAGAGLPDARQQYLQGKYEECITACETAMASGARSEDWPLLLQQAQMTLGRYPDALATVTNALARTRSSVRLRWALYEAWKANGDPAAARRQLEDIDQLAGSRMWAYSDAPNIVALGRTALALGADPRLVLERFFDEARRLAPESRDAVLAAGELALAKQDYALAASTFRAALQKNPDDPDFHYGVARACESSSRPDLVRSLERALQRNPRHVPSLLLLAEHQIDAEDYAGAEVTIDRILEVNPWQPEAWACRSVIHHLHGRKAEEEAARDKALHFAPANPAVDHLIGRKLSQKYRFAEGAEHQRTALGFEGTHLPSLLQLAQDFLRLGYDTQGWQLAKIAHQRDGYDITAFNLVTLHDTLTNYTVLTNDNFIVRMSHREAAVYGDRVLDLLASAAATLTAKYGATLERPVVVELFSNQRDFAVRTFGMPDNPGFLGVCFGHVITANSPSAQSHPVNWEAVLWHEFTHVVTLQLTKNKMPRWLSEGISVFEERQQHPTWGQQFSPRFREMILGDDLRPVGELSGAFLAPKTPIDLEFAYFESSLVVEFLVDRFGLGALREVLADLAADRPIAEALAARTRPMPELETEFATYARARAEAWGPNLDWRRPPVAVSSDRANYWELRHRSQRLLDEQQWAEAIEPLETLVRHLPGQQGADSAYAGLALVHRKLGDTNAEVAALKEWTKHDPETPDAPLRLMELASALGDWEELHRSAERLLAIRPMLPQPHRALAQASEATGKLDEAEAAWTRLLELDPADPAEAHFRLATLLHRRGDPAARRHVLQALEEAPRHREALALLLALQKTAPAPVPDPRPRSAADSLVLP